MITFLTRFRDPYSGNNIQEEVREKNEIEGGFIILQYNQKALGPFFKKRKNKHLDE